MQPVPASLPQAGPLAAFAFALSLAACAAFSVPALAQAEPEFNEIPYADGQWEIGRRFDESQLRYCVDSRDPDWEVAAAIADAIAGALLLQPQRYLVESEYVIEDITRIYAILLEHCDMHMGFKLIPDGYPQWLTITRAYYESSYAFVVADPAINSLADLAPGGTIGATIGTTAQVRLAAYNRNLPDNRKWRMFPYGTSEAAFSSLAAGSIDVALAWAPDFWALQKSDPSYANMRMIDPAPIPATTLGTGAVLLNQNTFLRSAVDQAITALVADGTIQSIIDSFSFPATAAR